MAGVGSPVVPSGLMVCDAFVVHGLTPMATPCRHFVAIAKLATSWLGKKKGKGVLRFYARMEKPGQHSAHEGRAGRRPTLHHARTPLWFSRVDRRNLRTKWHLVHNPTTRPTTRPAKEEAKNRSGPTATALTRRTLNPLPL
ncbi:hypothetical protein Rcae01_03614 [Novipirellula caenicola]|uniref:Uncharacterized protein n=1 Tax=Novipirellula caenicola TaxID=1536901 RepID=A0ABP9VX56_9BACT